MDVRYFQTNLDLMNETLWCHLKMQEKSCKNLKNVTCKLQGGIGLQANTSNSYMKKDCSVLALEALGKLLSPKFGIKNLRKGKFLNYFVGIIFGNFSGIQNFISRKKKYFHGIGL